MSCSLLSPGVHVVNTASSLGRNATFSKGTGHGYHNVMLLTSGRRHRHQHQVPRQRRLVLAVLQLLPDQGQDVPDPAGQAAPDGHVGVVRGVDPAEDWDRTSIRTRDQDEDYRTRMRTTGPG
ncbi:hypothetical protein EYF80_059102 [Liparis tanakae]|uniref:Uncharacterized protein n=1 Tax=Liparis tanakae TaxID=230148 RepID=A0A4Z2EPN2_9TELE|nr:hypothetical protein EYF80_059102 [Liparis tanakae]